MRYIQITIPAVHTAQQEVLIAQMGDSGYEGFEELENTLQAFIPEPDFDADLLERILAAASSVMPGPAASHQLNPPAIQPLPESAGLTYTQVLLEDRNWNQEWERNFDPVVVGTFCAIRASFHAPVPGIRHELLITPKMSFGTGHHATTCMMIEAMAELDFTRRSVLDFGTGTGVLAILAEKLGAREITAIDHDDWSIENAGENMSENHCICISLQKAEAIPSGPFDIILANINKNVLLKEMATIGQQLGEGGVILLSGLLPDDFEDIEKEALKNKLSISRRMAKANWICLKLEK